MNTDYQRPPIKVAAIGLGRSFFTEHYPVFKKHPTLFKLTAACDILKDRRDIVAKDFPECKMFRRLSDMLDERDIDLVDIATPSKEHVEHAMASLEHGYWTMVEPPVSLTLDEANRLRGATSKANNRLIVFHRGFFSPDFLLAKKAMNDRRLGQVHRIIVRRESYSRRYDWQTMKSLGGGACYYAMPDLIMQTLKLLSLPPIQMWSELKRIVAVGDTEDFAHVHFKTRGILSAEIEYNGGVLPPNVSPAFTIEGDRGRIEIAAGASNGRITFLNPEIKTFRRRSSVRTPPLDEPVEKIGFTTDSIALPKGTPTGESAFWKCVYDSVRTAAAFPLQFEDAIEAIRLAHLMKKTSPFGG